MNEILRRHSFSITFLIVLIGFFFLSGNDDDDIQQLSGFTMGTSYQFQLVEMPSDLTPEEISADVNELLMQLDTGISQPLHRVLNCRVLISTRQMCLSSPLHP